MPDEAERSKRIKKEWKKNINRIEKERIHKKITVSG